MQAVELTKREHQKNTFIYIIKRWEM